MFGTPSAPSTHSAGEAIIRNSRHITELSSSCVQAVGRSVRNFKFRTLLRGEQLLSRLLKRHRRTREHLFFAPNVSSVHKRSLVCLLTLTCPNCLSLAYWLLNRHSCCLRAAWPNPVKTACCLSASFPGASLPFHAFHFMPFTSCRLLHVVSYRLLHDFCLLLLNSCNCLSASPANRPHPFGSDKKFLLIQSRCKSLTNSDLRHVAIYRRKLPHSKGSPSELTVRVQSPKF